MKKTPYRGKYPRNIKTYFYGPKCGHHVWLNDGSHYQIAPILPAKDSPKPGQDFDTLNGTTFTSILMENK
ncbi:MAG: hypothetical protein EG826_17855 [Deltaproteobacteria bacterium]|nr:hypothetical protein [Deltaproteobacteria bacterium]